MQDAGEHVEDGRDPKTGIPIKSLYGKTKRPPTDWLEGLDWVIYDIQDVGVRFYTYSTTLSYVIDACVEAGVPLMIMDRGNPNGHYIDGPILKPGFESMVGLQPYTGGTRLNDGRICLHGLWCALDACDRE